MAHTDNHRGILCLPTEIKMVAHGGVSEAGCHHLHAQTWPVAHRLIANNPEAQLHRRYTEDGRIKADRSGNLGDVHNGNVGMSWW